MGAGASATASGVVFGLAVVFLAQELGFLDLGVLLSAILALVVSAAVFGVAFGVIGRALGQRYLKRHMVGAPPSKPESPPAAPAPTTTTGSVELPTEDEGSAESP